MCLKIGEHLELGGCFLVVFMKNEVGPLGINE